jgi:two-component system chemotaxis response regulator CheB
MPYPFPPPTIRDIVVIGASAGGVTALLELVERLPADFPAAVCVVLHIPAYATSELPYLLSKAGPLPAHHPLDGEVLQPGTIYVAPPDHHLLVEGDRVLVRHGPKENRFRPSVDALFRSAAYMHGPRVIGVVLTGYLDDGTSGLWTVQRLGGVTVVQDPREAYVPDMPTNALAYVAPDYVVPLAGLAPLLIELTARLAPAPPPPPAELARIRIEVDTAKGANAYELHLLEQGEPVPFVCPECYGPLVQLVEGPVRRFRCRTGHGFTLAALLAGVREAVETHLYNALHSLEEAQLLLLHLGEQESVAGQTTLAEVLQAQATQAGEQARQLQQVLTLSTASAGGAPPGAGRASV